MTSDQIAESLHQLGLILREQPSVRRSVLQRIASLPADAAAPLGRLRGWRFRLAWGALAAGLLFLLVLLPFYGRPGAAEIFAQATDRLAHARTFTCRQIFQHVTPDGRTVIEETRFYFKEPALERLEIMDGQGNIAEITIKDYAQRRALTLKPGDKTAALSDITHEYDVNGKTGELVQSQLDTQLRQRVLKITAQPVQDMGTTQLDGRTVRVLTSRGRNAVRTVYVDPQTRAPVQITEELPGESKQKWTYASIMMDGDWDDKLFSLDVPAGYQLYGNKIMVPAPERQARMMRKMMQLTALCAGYATDHHDEYPAELSQLVGHGTSAAALSKLLAAPESPDGPPAIAYRRPTDDAHGQDWGRQIVAYELPQARRDHVVVVGMRDIHGEVLPEAMFEELMK